MMSKPQALLVCLFLICPLWSLSDGVAHATSDDSIQIDVPASAQVRIENQFGQVSVEVWKQRQVSVAATIEGDSAQLARSPVVIERKSQLLLISVVRRPNDRASAVNLTVRLPEDAHAELVTNSGAILISGSLASAKLKSVSGNIRAEIADPLNIDISARSGSRPIRSELAIPLGGEGRILQARLGTGASMLQIDTVSGEITLSASPNEVSTTSRPPKLANTETTAGAGTPASSADSEEVSEGDVIRVDAQLATLNLSVIDRNTNRGLVGLKQDDFRLFEDGVEQQILQFESSSAPFDLILLIDVSGSTRDVVKLIRSAALRFIEAARPSDRIGIITFAKQPVIVSPVTLDREILRQRVNEIDTASGDTKLYDALDFSVSELLKSTRNSRRAAIVMMSDGLDGSIPGVQGEGSRLSYREVFDRVREFDGVLYTLWLNTEYEALSALDTQPEAFDSGYERMKEMAEAGGGVFYQVDRLEDLAGAYERVVADLGTVYSLAYRPTNRARDGKWRAVRVNLSVPSAVARGKHGYYAN